MNNSLDIVAVLKHDYTLVILFCCSILSIVFIIERWIYFRTAAADRCDDILARVRKYLEAGQAQQAKDYCQKQPSVVAQVVAYGLACAGQTRRDMEDLLATKRLEERMKLERFLAVLGTLGNIAPFIGLFGTVVGIIDAFQELALAGTGGPAVVAKGIAEALVATAGGLVVAIPAVIFYNYFMRRVKAASTEMEVASTRLVVMLGAK
ncbi:MAG TPA: MotA/TolQ/ExbB proton channel family protein [Elusimicrobiota bacterium]|nr:MotA/TolQ/ExbB proton channel family protein [Elusimicrobiota bacterium]